MSQHDREDELTQRTQLAQDAHMMALVNQKAVERMRFWGQILGGALLAAFLAGVAVPAYIDKAVHGAMTQELATVRVEVADTKKMLERLLEHELEHRTDK